MVYTFDKSRYSKEQVDKFTLEDVRNLTDGVDSLPLDEFVNHFNLECIPCDSIYIKVFK